MNTLVLCCNRARLVQPEVPRDGMPTKTTDRQQEAFRTPLSAVYFHISSEIR